MPSRPRDCRRWARLSAPGKACWFGDPRVAKLLERAILSKVPDAHKEFRNSDYWGPRIPLLRPPVPSNLEMAAVFFPDTVQSNIANSCLSVAHDVRVLLFELAERLGEALKDEQELNDALSRSVESRGVIPVDQRLREFGTRACLRLANPHLSRCQQWCQLWCQRAFHLLHRFSTFCNELDQKTQNPVATPWPRGRR